MQHAQIIAASAVALALVTAAPRTIAAHGEIPDADVACTGSVLLNDDLAPRTDDATERARRTVSARAEILDASGSPVGTLYLDDRGDRYVTLESEAAAEVAADFALAKPSPSGAGPQRLAAGFTLAQRYHLAACR